MGWFAAVQGFLGPFGSTLQLLATGLILVALEIILVAYQWVIKRNFDRRPNIFERFFRGMGVYSGIVAIWFALESASPSSVLLENFHPDVRPTIQIVLVAGGIAVIMYSMGILDTSMELAERIQKRLEGDGDSEEDVAQEKDDP